MKKINKELFGNRLKDLMRDYNETTYSLGETLNLSPPTISRYTQGKMFPKMTTIEAIANHFSVNPEWLIGASNSIYANEVLYQESALTSVPVFNSIQYDLPLFSNEKSDSNLYIPIETLSKWGAVIGLRVNDDSMKPIMEKGDSIIIKLGSVKLPNNYVAVHVNESDVIVRKVLQQKKHIILQPASFLCDAQVYNVHTDNIQVIGQVVYIHKEKNELLEN